MDESPVLITLSIMNEFDATSLRPWQPRGYYPANRGSMSN